MVVWFRDSAGVQRGNATCTAHLQSNVPDKRRLFVGRWESSCANVCSIDCDRILDLTLAPEVYENDGIIEDEEVIPFEAYQ